MSHHGGTGQKVSGRVTDSLTTLFIKIKCKANNLDGNKRYILEPTFSGNEVQCHDSFSAHLFTNQAAAGLGQVCFLSLVLTVETGLNEAFGLRIRVLSMLYLYYLEEKK